MRQSLIQHLKAMKIAEVGVRFGDNARSILDSVPHCKLYLVDSYDINNSTNQTGSKPMDAEERAELIVRVRKSLEPYGDRAKLMVMDSAQAARKFPDNYFDYVYLDAQHEKANVLVDIGTWWPKVKEGGTLGGHDIEAIGVKNAVHEFFDDYHTDSEDWWVFK